MFVKYESLYVSYDFHVKKSYIFLCFVIYNLFDINKNNRSDSFSLDYEPDGIQFYP